MSNRAQWQLVAGLVAVLFVLIGAGWTVRDRFLPVDVGDPAPPVTGTDLSGRPVSLADLEGEVVLLNVWATWCPPCRDEMPSMQRLHEALGGRGLNVVAVSVDAPLGLLDRLGKPGGDVAAFAAEMGLTFPIWLDPEGETFRRYRMIAVPESFVITRSGMIYKKHPGAREWDSPEMVELLTQLIEE